MSCLGRVQRLRWSPLIGVLATKLGSAVGTLCLWMCPSAAGARAASSTGFPGSSQMRV